MTDKSDIIILKRVEAEEDQRKKGVWKIAHADFMTAMMAFFLIMWLVNATDEEIKKSIANYFNPINLMASPTDRRGLMDPTEDLMTPASGDEEGQSTGARPMGADTPGSAGNAAGGGNVEEGNERRMDSAGILEETDGAAFHDPYAVMASAAADLAPDEPLAVDVPQTTQGAPGHTAVTENVRDPFDPAYWQTVSPRPARSVRPGPADAADRLPPDAEIDAADRRPTEPPEPEAARQRPAMDARTAPQEQAPDDASGGSAGDAPAGSGDAVAGVGPRSAAAEAVLATLEEAPDPAEQQQGAENSSAAERRRTVEATAEALREALDGVAAGVTVSVEERGGEKSLLISLTDERTFSMFPIGSASPTEEARELFTRVAGVLANRAGDIVVRGHTDARPFRGGSSDNWVLSFARAHSTKQSLVAAGIAEARVVRVEGLADREPSDPDDPFAAENRRIEILYQPNGVTP